jgi:hypothetical protein
MGGCHLLWPGRDPAKLSAGTEQRDITFRQVHRKDLLGAYGTLLSATGDAALRSQINLTIGQHDCRAGPRIIRIG